MIDILTITFNPAIDKSVSIEALVPEVKLKCTQPKYEPGGGGINVSRVIKRMGGKTNALFLGGGPNGKLLHELLIKEEVNASLIQCKNNTRENLIVFENKSFQQYRFGMPSEDIFENEYLSLLDFLKKENQCEYWVISGSIPNSIPPGFIESVINIGKKKKIKVIADTSGVALKSIINEGLFMIKPNINELGNIAGVELMSQKEIIQFARNKISNKQLVHLVVSLGAEGALLITKDNAYKIKPPSVKRISTVGAGDSMVGGIVYSFSIGKNILEAVQYGVASGTAATINPGTELCHKSDVESLLNQITTLKLD
jgi:6-phosphofructokinase 2